VTLDGETLTPAEWRKILAGTDGLVLIKGQWAVVDRARLAEVLQHWKTVEAKSRTEGLTFLQGMRLLAGAPTDPGAADESADGPGEAAWAQVTAGPWLDEVLADLRSPDGSQLADPGDALGAVLRPYQRDGVAWLWLLHRLGLGACLADDMGLGKTLQVLALLLLVKRQKARAPSLVVVPASLLGNWRAEADRFAPSLRIVVAHASELAAADRGREAPAGIAEADVVLTTYGTVLRTPWIGERSWGLGDGAHLAGARRPGADPAPRRVRDDARGATTPGLIPPPRVSDGASTNVDRLTPPQRGQVVTSISNT